MEKATSKELFRNPKHPYTQALLDAIPLPSLKEEDKLKKVIKGEVSSPINPKPGCRFSVRCPHAKKECQERNVPLVDQGDGHCVACVPVSYTHLQILMAICIVAALGQGAFNLLIAMSASTVPKFVRIVRSSVLSLKQEEYIEAARACGTGDGRIIYRHVLPNVMGPIIVQATITMAMTILAISSLSFIGLGVPTPQPEWGTILSENKSQMRYYPYLCTIPGIAILVSVIAMNLIGDGLRDALDPKLKN